MKCISMLELINQFNRLYPLFSTVSFQDDCIIHEGNVQNNNKDLLSITIRGISGELFPNSFMNSSTSFYKKAKSLDPVISDNCDGMLYTEVDGRKILLVCELKSGFDIDRLCHAKEQIVGSYIRLRAQLSILQSKSEYEFHGMIASYLPTSEKLTQIKNCNDMKAKFAKGLYILSRYNMIETNCKSFYYPIDVPGFTIHYVGVPLGCQNYEIGIRDIIK